MKASKTLEYLHNIRATLDETTRRNVDIISESAETFPPSDIAAALGVAIRETLREVRNEQAKQDGRAKAKKAAERILKDGGKMRDCFGYAYTVGDCQYICDGYKAIKYADPLPLPALPAGVEYVNIAVIDDIIAQSRDGETVNAPDVDALKSYIKREKATRGKSAKILYDFGAGLPVVDARFLLDMLEALPGAVLKVAKGRPDGVNLNAVYFENGANVGAMLPVRPAANLERKTTTL